LFLGLAQPLRFVARHQHDDQHSRNDRIVQPQIIVILQLQGVNDVVSPKRFDAGALQLKLDPGPTRSAMRKATSDPEIDAVVIDFRHVDREPRDGDNGSNIDSAELLLTLAKVHHSLAPTVFSASLTCNSPESSLGRRLSRGSARVINSMRHEKALSKRGSVPIPERDKTDNISRGGLAVSRPTLQHATTRVWRE